MSLAAELLFAITMVPNTLAANHMIHLPDWFTMGGIDDARAIQTADAKGGERGLRSILPRETMRIEADNAYVFHIDRHSMTVCGSLRLALHPDLFPFT
jgi:hypothetical protein